MGRGRQKAKQTKVARELKYFSPDTNYRALEQELSSRGHNDLVTETRPPVGEEANPSWKSWPSDDEDDDDR